MVNPISYQPQQAYSGGADFSQLANLGNVYQKAQEQARQQSALGMLGQGEEADTRTLLQSGVLPLAQLGLGMQDKSVTRQREDLRNVVLDRRADTADRRAGGYLTIAQQQERRASEASEEATPEGRRKKLIAANMNPDDPNFAAHIATGAALPTPIAMEIEKRAKIAFEQSQKYATREQRLQHVQDGELNINDPDIRRWVALGGDPPDPAKSRLGLGAPTYTRDKDGVLRAYQLSANGIPVEVKVREGEQILGPGETAQQKAEGAATGKAVAAAKVGLPDVVRNTEDLVSNIDKILGHGSKDMALGRGSQLPDWMVAGTGIADFREMVKQLGGEAMGQQMQTLKGAGLGSVSDFEQKNMIAAFVRASTAQTVRGFTDAMNDAKRSAEKIREIARAKAKGDFSEKPNTPAATPGARPPLGSIFGN